MHTTLVGILCSFVAVVVELSFKARAACNHLVTLDVPVLVPAEAINPCTNSLAVRTWTLSAGLGSKIH